MFNQEFKKIFISTLDENRRQKAGYVMSNLENGEIHFKKDALYFTPEEFFESLSMINSRSPIIQSLSALFKKYKKWGIVNGFIPNEDLRYYSNATKKAKISPPFVGSAQHLFDILSESFCDSSEMSIDVLYKAICWIVFSGVPIGMISALSKNNVYDDGTIHFCGHTHHIFELGIEDVILARDTDYFNTYANGTIRKMPRIESQQFISGRSERTKVSIDAIFTRINRKIKSAGYSVTLRGLYYSGAFCREEERIKSTPEENEYSFDELIDEDKYALPRGIADEMEHQTKRRYIEIDFNNWRRMFR